MIEDQYIMKKNNNNLKVKVKKLIHFFFKSLFNASHVHDTPQNTNGIIYVSEITPVSSFLWGIQLLYSLEFVT